MAKVRIVAPGFMYGCTPYPVGTTIDFPKHVVEYLVKTRKGVLVEEGGYERRDVVAETPSAPEPTTEGEESKPTRRKRTYRRRDSQAKDPNE